MHYIRVLILFGTIKTFRTFDVSVVVLTQRKEFCRTLTLQLFVEHSLHILWMMHTVIVMLPRKSKKEKNKLFNFIIIENACFLFGVHIYFWVVRCSVILKLNYWQFILLNISIKFSFDVLSSQEDFIGCLKSGYHATGTALLAGWMMFTLWCKRLANFLRNW